MRDRSAASRQLRPQRRPDRAAQRTTRRPCRTSTRWLPVIINSTFLVGAGTLTIPAPRVNTDPVAIRRVMACGPFGSVAERYVDRKKACRRARQEALRSLRTGRDPDWGDVIRDSRRGASKRPRRHENSGHQHRHANKHKTNPTQPGASPTTGLMPPPSRIEKQPLPTATTHAPSETAGSPRTRPAPRTTARVVLDGHRTQSFPWGGAVALLALTFAAAHATRHRRAFVRLMRTVIRGVKRKSRPALHATSTPAASCASPDVCRVFPLAADAVALAGPGAEDAVRHLAMDILSRRRGDSTDLVVSRSDAWRLFGTDIGTLQEDRVPGLLLTDDPEQTHTVLARQTPTRRVLVTYDGETEDFRGLINHQQGQLAVVSLSPGAWAPMKVSANGAVTRSNDAAPSAVTQLPLLSRADAFNQLMSMPTLARVGER